MHFVDEQNQVRPLLDLPDHVLDSILEHAAQHRPRDHRVHLQVDDLAVAQPDRHSVGLEFEAPRDPFGDGRLADARLAQEQDGIRALAMTEDLENALHLGVAPEDGRDLVLHSRAERYTRGLQRTHQAARRFERADLGAQFHQSLIDQPRLGFAHGAGCGIPQRLGIFFLPAMDTREDPSNVAVDDGIRLIEGNAQNCPGHVLSDARKFDQCSVVRRNLAAMLFHNRTRSGHQVFGAPIIAQAGPEREHALFAGFA